MYFCKTRDKVSLRYIISSQNNLCHLLFTVQKDIFEIKCAFIIGRYKLFIGKSSKKFIADIFMLSFDEFSKFYVFWLSCRGHIKPFSCPTSTCAELHQNSLSNRVRFRNDVFQYKGDFLRILVQTCLPCVIKHYQ